LASKFAKVDKAFQFFKEQCAINSSFTILEIKNSTGWSESTIKTYINKRWKSFLLINGKDLTINTQFDVYDIETFRQHHSQNDFIKKQFYQLLVEKSVSACISSIEIYNKPDFKFREESFSILISNAWELLLKAKILHLNGNDIKSIQIIKKQKPQVSVSGNPKTISLGKAVNILESSGMINKIVADNLKLLIEIRDESIHFIHEDRSLEIKIQSIGTATLKNFITLATHWFGYDFQKFNFYLMPVSFYHLSDMESFSISKSAGSNFKKYLNNMVKEHEDDIDPLFSVSLRLETKLIKTTSDEAMHVRLTNNPDAPEFQVTEEDALKNYPYTYNALYNLLRKRYDNFKKNEIFHAIMRELRMQGEKFCKDRLLDPSNPKSTHKMFYHNRIVEEFDKHYKKI